MAPASRCDLKRPCTPHPPDKGAKSVTATTIGENASTKSKTGGTSSTNVPSEHKLSDPSAVRNKPSNPSSAVRNKLSDPPAASNKLTDPPAVSSKRFGKSQEFPEELGVEIDVKEKSDDSDTQESADNVPDAAHEERTRDSAEVLEEDTEFRTAVTRDSYEAEQHAGHEIGGEGGEGGKELNACEILRRLKAEVEEATATGECQQMACPSLDQIGTPGDVCAQFCHDRMDSPKSVTDLELELADQAERKYCAKWRKKKGLLQCDMRLGLNKLVKDESVCKGTYKTDEVYTSLWGSSKAMDYRKRLEAQMKKKRNLLEKMHLKEFLRRQKMRRRAKEKRVALKHRDPNKIAKGNDNLRINKSYDLRVNYNKQLPMMPIAMQQHFDKFKKPPFKTYVTGQKGCIKRIDEFEKLRVPEKEKK